MNEDDLHLFTITVEVFVDSDGKRQHEWSIDGECTVYEGIGAIEAAKLQMWQDANAEAS